jgi:sigma-B regulation protein RsbU (phosphoserine phosphatase)
VHAGAQDYLVKGRITGAELIRTIRYAIERKKAEEQLKVYAEELRSRNAQLEDDLDMARQAQQALLPQSYPILPPSARPEQSAVRFSHVYRPSYAVGGDFFHVLPVSDTQVGVVICDVMGHGIRASLITAIVRGLLEERRTEADSPSRFLSTLNRGLMSVTHQPDQLMFVSSAYVLADVAAGRLEYANAGHPSPIHIHRQRGEAEFLCPDENVRGPALGVVAGFEYASRRIPVEEGDFVLLFTDGLCEAHDAAGSEYGESGLLEAVRGALHLDTDPLVHSVMDSVQDFAAQTDLEDDQCLVAMQVVRIAGHGNTLHQGSTG